ncbi:zinc finger protein 395 isoform X2 [Chelonus insularis]|uniref:zinc finger protein 395 isoform X2 n=1 Tax=Chelonus insularis TaxID=460826 RepID=UPI00158ACD82|nr:zinc finger protein 395 isoform X2 [Chelonus insularis]
MSTGKRLAKRSIIGTRVCAPGSDGKYYSGVIHAVKTPASASPESGLRITPKTRYSVHFDPLPGDCRPPSPSTEYADRDLIGPGFGSVTNARLVPGQKVYLTYNGREIHAEVTQHKEHLEEVEVAIGGQEQPLKITKRIDEIRLLESRKSARLADQDTDFARLADMAGDRKRASSHSIDVPHVPGSRKRRPSSGNDSDRLYPNGWLVDGNIKFGHGHGCGREGCRTNERGDCMDECTAALVLMSLSCSPHSPHHSFQPAHCQSNNSNNSIRNNINTSNYRGDTVIVGSPGASGTSNSSSSCDASWRTGTPSPPLSDEGAPSQATAWPNSRNARSSSANTTPTFQNQHTFVFNLSGSSGSTPNSDEGIVTDYLEEMHPRKKKREHKNQPEERPKDYSKTGYDFEKCISPVSTMVFKCTWPGCTEIRTTCPLIEKHVRQSHLGPKKSKTCDKDDDFDMSDHEEEFYYQEVAINHMSSPPTMSHRDMARPPHEDPEYQKQLRLEANPIPTTTTINNHNNSNDNNNNTNNSNNISSNSNNNPVHHNNSHLNSAPTVIHPTKERLFNFRVSPIRPRSPATPMKTMKHSSRQLNHHNINVLAVTTAIGKMTASPRRVRGDTKKCRKIYGMENREQWCTQCKWKKACVRFAE